MDLTLQTKLGCALIGAGHLIIATGIVDTYKSLYGTHHLQYSMFSGFVGFLTVASLVGVLQNT